jgi:hypothetical protein
MYIKSPNVLKLCNATSYVPLIITQQPLGGFASETGTFSFNIKLIGSRPFTFNWYKDDILIPNQNSNVLTITNATSSDTAVYYCEINNNRFSKKTNSIKLGVISYLNIVKQPSEVVTKALLVTVALVPISSGEKGEDSGSGE